MKLTLRSNADRARYWEQLARKVTARAARLEKALRKVADHHCLVDDGFPRSKCGCLTCEAGRVLSSMMVTEPNKQRRDEMIEADVKELCDSLRTEIKVIEEKVRGIREHKGLQGEQAYRYQHDEVIAQSMLAVRHLEDARMRLGKVIQYARDGVSILDVK